MCQSNAACRSRAASKCSALRIWGDIGQRGRGVANADQVFE